jgi:hypothetical protein
MYEQKGKNYDDDDDDDYTTLRNLVYKIIKRGRYSETERKKKKYTTTNEHNRYNFLVRNKLRGRDRTYQRRLCAGRCVRTIFC